jgi:hypothetical protein
MFQADFLSNRNPWWLGEYKSKWSCCFRAPIRYLEGKVRVSKKHVFGSSAGRRGGKQPNSCLCVGCPDNMLNTLHITARQ